MSTVKTLHYAPNVYNNKNKNHKSTKLIMPKSVGISKWTVRYGDVWKFSCACSSSSSSRPPNWKVLRHFSPNLVEDFCSLFPANEYSVQRVVNLINNVSQRQILSITVAVDDEEGQLRQKIDDLVIKEDYLFSTRKRIDIVLEEVVPLLLENANRWISSRLDVSQSQVVYDKLESSDIPEEALIRYSSKRTLCTKVFVEVVIPDTIDDKFKEIHTHDDLKALFHHLISREGISSAFAVCLISLISKEKKQAWDRYYPAPSGNQADANRDGLSPLEMKIFKYVVDILQFIVNLV